MFPKHAGREGNELRMLHAAPSAGTKRVNTVISVYTHIIVC